MDVRRYKLVIWGLFLAQLMGCASTPKPKDELIAPVEERLSSRDLPAGECGLFVWTGDAKRRFILFSQAAKISGAWLSNEGEVEIFITDQDGNPANRQFPTVNYKTEDGTILKLSLKNRQPITDGTRFKTGTLRIVGVDGWQRVIPIVGLSACQPT